MLCEGAMMCALTALLLLINRVAGGMIETAFPWLLVFPLLVYCARYGVRTALIFCVSILLLSLMLCTFTTLFYVFSASLCALAYGSGVRRGAANRSLLLRTGLISFLSNLLSMVVLASLFGYDPAEEAKLLIELLHADPSMVMRSALVLAVFTVVVCSLLQTLCIHFGALLLLGRIGIPTHPVKAAHEISGPRWLGVTILMIWVLYSGFKQFRERKNVPDPLFKGSGTVFCPTVNVACVPYRLIFFPRVDFRYHSRSKFIG